MRSLHYLQPRTAVNYSADCIAVVSTYRYTARSYEVADQWVPDLESRHISCQCVCKRNGRWDTGDICLVGHYRVEGASAGI